MLLLLEMGWETDDILWPASGRVWLSGIGEGSRVHHLRLPRPALLPAFFRGETEAQNGEVFSQGPAAIWRQDVSSSHFLSTLFLLPMSFFLLS